MSVLDPTPEAPPGVGRELTPTSYLLLGMVRLGFRSGYAVKKAADRSTRTIWPISLAQVYPELGRLHELGLLSRSNDPRGAQARSAYALTRPGEDAFQDWLRSPELAPTQVRDEGLLRLFFADRLSIADQLRLIRRLRDNDRLVSTEMRQLVGAAGPDLLANTRYPGVIARLGAGTFAFSVRWMTRLAAEIEQGAARSASRAAQNGAAAPAGAPRPGAPIKLTTTSHLILAMVGFGATSGYAIKKAAELSTQSFWPTSFAQLYPQLAAMHAAGLLDKCEDPDGGRERFAYSITERGAASLTTWLRSPRIAPGHLRHEAMLRLFFADALPFREQLALVARYREKQLRRVAGTRAEIVPLGELAQYEQGTRYPAILAHYAVDKFSYSSAWLGRLERQMKAGKLPPLAKRVAS